MRYLFIGTAIVLAAALPADVRADAGSRPIASASADCRSLTSLRLPDVSVTAAAESAGPSPGSPVTVAHCRVTGVVGSEIGFEILMPDDWNGRFAMGGAGGFAGTTHNDAAEIVNAGFATASTDTGHEASGIDAGWALGHVERQVNYGYLGVHRVAEVAKAVIRAYYGRDASHAYFLGCSNGGREGLMEAERFPADFEGVLSGAPAYNFTRVAASFLRNVQATFPDPHHLDRSTISPDALHTVAAAALAACDAGDGVKDGVIGDPSRCDFSVERVQSCPNDVAAPGCLTSIEKKAVAAIYSPTVDAGGESYPGQPPGGEADDGGWRTWITGVDPRLSAGSKGRIPSLQYAFATEFYKYFVFGDRNWDYSHYDVASSGRDTALVSTFLNADAANLSAFKARGGRLLLWHGWADPALNPLSTIAYYKAVEARDAALGGYVRLFMLPGVLHCGGGAGPDHVDWRSALVDWVEHGKAPDRLVASKRGAGGTTLRTRPVCAYPLRAVYAGTGSTDEEASFTCAAR